MIRLLHNGWSGISPLCDACACNLRTPQYRIEVLLYMKKDTSFGGAPLAGGAGGFPFPLGVLTEPD